MYELIFVSNGDGTAYVTGVTGTPVDVVIPTTSPTGDTVTSLGAQCFRDKSSLVSISLPSSLTTLRSSCFQSCASLSAITIPEGVISLADYCFHNCTSLSAIVLPSGLIYLGNQCFRGCASLSAITLPEGLTTLGTHCFYGCSALSAIVLPSGVTTLGTECFQSCTSLSAITLPEGLTTLGRSCFQSCASLSAITIPEGVTSLGDGCFYGCTSLTTITIPEGVISLADYCFHGCTALSAIVLPEGIITLGIYCFYGCTSLSAITLPNSLTSLGTDCFHNCTSLSAITIPEGVTTLGERCFFVCTSLTSITLPNSLTTLGRSCFFGCTSLTTITILEGVISLADFCFYGCTALSAIVLPSGLIYLGTHCFYGCSALSAIVLPSGVTTLGTECFYNCTSLSAITLPEGVTSLGDGCFRGCTSLGLIVFEGNAPTARSLTFLGVPGYGQYYSEATGFTDPWYGLPMVMLNLDNALLSDMLSLWTVPNLKTARYLLSGCTALGKFPDFSTWNLSATTSLKGMLEGAGDISNLFNLSTLDISSVSDLSDFLKSFTSENPIDCDLSTWTPTYGTNFSEFFHQPNITPESYDKFITMLYNMELSGDGSNPPPLPFNMGTLTYSSAVSAMRQALIDGYGYSFTDGVATVIQPVKSVVFDIADSWGDIYLTIRSIEFKNNGELIANSSPTAYAGSTYHFDGYSPSNVFNTTLSKTGSSGTTQWAASDIDSNVRLMVVFASPITFDEIVVNNGHISGNFTQRGAKTVKITVSPDTITDTTYDAAVSNGTVLITSDWAQHVPVDVVDDQTVWQS